METRNSILAIADPEDYDCRIEGYAVGHKEMLIMAAHTKRISERFYIFFFDVLCFSGMFNWQGAILRMGSNEEYLQFVAQMMPVPGISNAELLDKEKYGSLYIFDAGSHQIRLVATHMEHRQTLW